MLSDLHARAPGPCAAAFQEFRRLARDAALVNRPLRRIARRLCVKIDDRVPR